MPITKYTKGEHDTEDVYSVEELLEQFYLGIETLDNDKLRRTPPYIIASFLSRLPTNDCRAVLRKLPDVAASAILEEMDAEASAEIVADMREFRALKILEEFELDDVTDVISELEEPDRVRLLSKLSPEKAKQVRALLKYAPETAGGVMNPNFISVQEYMTVNEAIEHIRRLKDKITHMTYVYVVDKSKKLKGFFSMKDLVLAKADEKIANIMQTDLKGVCSVNEDREKIALTMGELNLYELPVVDDQGRLLGIVEHDDVIDILQDEATEDLQKMVGAGADEAIHDEISYSIKRRSPWLLVNLITALFGAIVISFFRKNIEELPLLAVFMASVASLGGNTGSQTLAVAIRSLAVGEIEEFDSLRVCIKEGIKGLINGLLIGLAASLAIYIVTKDLKLGLVIFSAMVLNMGMGGLVGAFIPLMLKRFGFDPAQSSSIFLTGVTDMCGFFIFLSLGAWLLF